MDLKIVRARGDHPCVDAPLEVGQQLPCATGSENLLPISVDEIPAGSKEGSLVCPDFHPNCGSRGRVTAAGIMVKGGEVVRRLVLIAPERDVDIPDSKMSAGLIPRARVTVLGRRSQW